MLTIRLRRMGRKNRAFYRFVVSDSRRAPTASAVEEVGHYDPLQKPPVLQIQQDRIDYWVSNGATLSNTVKTLMRRAENGIMVEDKPKEAKPKEAKAAPEAPKAEAATEAAKNESQEAKDEAQKATEAKETADAKTEEAATEAKAAADAPAAGEAEASETKSEGETSEDSGSA